MGIATLPEGRMEQLSSVSHHVAELVNLPLLPQLPYVGQSAFAHKAGLHTSAIARRPDSYEHVDPAAVGNGTRFLVSDLSGRATIELKAKELGIDLDGAQAGAVVEELKELEHKGYHFEVADGSLELLMRHATGWEQTFFELESFRVIVDHQAGGTVDTEATIKVRVGDERIIATGEGNGPVNALDAALRAAIGGAYPELDDIHLVDFKVRVLDTGAGTGAITRVLLDSADAEDTWSTIGVSENVIEASWQALLDSLVYGLLRRRG
jgi:2-isopropylmalate synthase